MASLSPILVLQARAEARALLYAACEFDLFDALEPLHRFAVESEVVNEVGAEAVLAIIKSAFTKVAEL